MPHSRPDFDKQLPQFLKGCDSMLHSQDAPHFIRKIPENRSRLVILGMVVSIGLFVLSMFFDGFYLAQENPRAWCVGWAEFLFGWITAFSGTAAWLANPTVLLAWILAFVPMRAGATVISGVAFAFAASFLCERQILTDEAGGRAVISGYGAGYGIWCSSMAVMFLICFVDQTISRRSRNQ